MTAMGPEAAMLSGRLAREGSWRTLAALEYAEENPLYVEAAGAAALEGERVADQPRTAVGTWVRLRAVFHTDGARGPAARSLSALPIARIEATDAGARIAAMPLYVRARR